jgi:hypothetical protein
MINPTCSRRQAVFMLCIAATFGSTLITEAIAQVAASTATVRIRGNVVSVSATNLVVKDRSGEVVDLLMTDKLVVSEVYLIKLEDIKPGSYIGTAAMPQADGTQRAIAVSVFPEAARGTGEGHRPFDLLPQSTMTNATVDDVAVAGNTAAGRMLRLKYKDGEKTVVVPADAPIVTSRPADRSLLVAGASVSLFAQAIDGKPTALRINVGKNGFALPY